MRYCLAFVALFSTFFALASPSSTYDFDLKQWNTANGLSSNSIRSITQDQQGYIWLGTLYGLNRFDGQKFTTFGAFNTRQIPSNAINKLLMAQSGYLWIGTNSGLAGVDPKTLKFDRFPILSEVTSIVERSEDEIWVAAENLFRIKADHSISRVDAIKESVVRLARADDGMWVSTARNLYRVAKDDSVLTIALPDKLQQHPISDLFWKDNTLHIVSEIGYYLLNKEGSVELAADTKSDFLATYKYMQDSRGHEWLSGYHRLLYRKSPDQEWLNIGREELGTPPWFVDIFEDKEQNIWFASFSEGVFQASPTSVQRVIGHGQEDVVVRSLSLVPELNGLVVATQTGLGLLDESSRFHLWLDASQLGNRVVHDMTLFNKKLWLGTERGLFVYDPATKQLSEPFGEFKDSFLRVVQPRSEGGLWLGGAGGLYSFDGTKLEAASFNSLLESNFVTVIAPNKQGLYIGTTSGVFQHNEQGLKRVGLGSMLYGAYITKILTLPDERLVVATLDQGLFIQTQQKTWLHYESQNVLPQDPVVTLWYDAKSEYVWASTLKGIFRIHSAELNLPEHVHPSFEHVLIPSDWQPGTIPGRCCNGFGHSKVAMWQDKLWYPSLKGIVTVPLGFLSTENKLLKPRVDVVQGSQVYPVKPDQTRVVLELSDRSISINFSAMEFKKPSSLEFRYRLIGFDDQWRYDKLIREATYANLLPGVYQFVVQVRYNGRSWTTEHQQQIELVIPQMFHETLLYKALWVILVVLALYVISWLWRRNNRLQQSELGKLVRSRTFELESSNSQLSELNEQLLQLTHKDALTGLRNRRFLFEQMPKDVEQYQRNRKEMLPQGKSIGIIYLDVDNFRQINEQFGNNVGDSLLQQLSGFLLRESQEADYVVRYSGDHFVLLLRDVNKVTVSEHVRHLNEQLVSHPFLSPVGGVVHLTASIGFAHFPLELLGGQLIGWEVSLQLAEICCQYVKNVGRNGNACLVFDSQVDAFEFEEVSNILELIEKCIATGLACFELYQPKN